VIFATDAEGARLL